MTSHAGRRTPPSPRPNRTAVCAVTASAPSSPAEVTA